MEFVGPNSPNPKKTVYPNDYNNFGPAFGFAWNVPWFGEGKTTVSVDLAQAIALTGRRVVLVELDLRVPTFARHFGLNPHRGVTTALLGG